MVKPKTMLYEELIDDFDDLFEDDEDEFMVEDMEEDDEEF